MSNTQSKNDSLKELNSKLVAEIAKLRKENAKLKQIIEENTKRDVRVEELEQKNTELEARLAILEQGVTGVTGQSQNNDIPEITVSVVDVSDSVVENLNNKVGRAVTCDNVPNDNTNNKSSENKEKKLQAQDLNLVTQPCNSATSEASATNIPESSHSDSNEIISQDETGKIRKKTGVEHKKGEGLDKLKHELFVSETSQEPSIEQNLVNEISETLCPGKITFDNISSIDEASQHLAQLCNKAFDAEDKANRANQEEILCWYLYAKDFRIQLNGIIENSEGKFGEKKARSLLYDSITKQLNLIRKQRSQELGLQLRDISRDSLRKKTQRAEKVYKFFEQVDIDKIRYIKSYSATSISELTNEQIQEIIDYGISLEKIPPETDYVTEISETLCPGKNLPNNTPIPRTNPNKMECLYQYAVDNDLDPEKFSVITKAEKDRWIMGCFRDDLERDVRFYRGGIESKEDPRKYRKFLTDRDRLIGEELLRRSILKSGLSTAWLDDLMKEWEEIHSQFVQIFSQT